MDIRVAIEAKELTNAIHALAKAMGNQAPPATVAVEEPDPPAAADEPEDNPAETKPSAADPPPTPTKEQVRAKLTEVSRGGKQDQVRAVLATFDAERLTDIPKVTAK